MKRFVQDRQEARAKNIVIVSACLDTLEDTVNTKRTEELRDYLVSFDMTFTEAKGCYKGTEETSFVCILNKKDDYILLKQIAFIIFNQESILLRSGPVVTLEYHDGSTEVIGKEIAMVTEHDALKEDAYTIMNGKHYIVK